MSFENAFSGIDAGRVSKVEEDNEVQEKAFVRDDSDNKLFPEIQVKDLLSSGLIKEDTEAYWDYDTPIFRIAQQMENKYIYIECKSDKTLHAELSNITEFKGRSKKVSETSWLGLLNVERDVKGLSELSVEDFEIQERQKLKYSKEKAMEQAKILHFSKVKQIRQQYNIKNVKLLLGEGSCFREYLPTVRLYKGNRSNSTRPLLLKELRAWLVEDQGAVMATPRKDGQMIECDDHIEIKKSEGYRHYRKNGWFSAISISSDKDSLNSAGIVINPDLYSGEGNPLKGTFKFPNAMLIEATDRCVGDVELVSTSGSPELKGFGFKFLLAQSHLNSDQADNYDALGHLKDAGYNMKFGVQAAYKVLKPCTTVTETLQQTVNTFAELLPYGVQYKDCHGEEHDTPTLDYMNTYFLVAYMSRSLDDKMDFYKLCKAFKVDTSAIVNNNEWTPPYEVINTEMKDELYNAMKENYILMQSEDLKSYKSLKKADSTERLDKLKFTVDNVLSYIEENETIMVQRNKLTGEIRTVTPKENH